MARSTKFVKNLGYTDKDVFSTLNIAVHEFGHVDDARVADGFLVFEGVTYKIDDEIVITIPVYDRRGKKSTKKIKTTLRDSGLLHKLNV